MENLEKEKNQQKESDSSFLCSNKASLLNSPPNLFLKKTMPKKKRIVGRRFLNPLTYEDPQYFQPSFFKFRSTPPPPLHPHPTHIPITLPSPMLFFVLCFFELMGDCVTYDVLVCLMTLWMPYQALVP